MDHFLIAGLSLTEIEYTISQLQAEHQCRLMELQEAEDIKIVDYAVSLKEA